MKIPGKIRLIQENMGVVDRSLRVIAGGSLIIPLVVTMSITSPFLMAGQPYALAVAFYLLLTGMMGWDPIYAVFRGRTCGLSRTNRCGTFMYQMKAAANGHPGRDPGYQAHAPLEPFQRIHGVLYGNWCWV